MQVTEALQELGELMPHSLKLVSDLQLFLPNEQWTELCDPQSSVNNKILEQLLLKINVCCALHLNGYNDSNVT